MGRPLPVELRERAVHAYLNGEGTYKEIAERFGVGEASVDRWVSRYRQSGSVEAKPMGGARHEHKVDEEGLAYLRLLLEDESIWTRQELCDEYFDAFGVRVSVATMGRAIRRLGFSRKRGS